MEGDKCKAGKALFIEINQQQNYLANASYEDWTHDPWFTRPVLYHWAKEAWWATV